MQRQCLWIIALMVLGIMLIGFSSWAAPPLVNYQGKLTDASGEPVTDPALSVIFRIFDAQTLGSLLWEEAQTVNVQDGIYNVMLGSGTRKGGRNHEK